MNNSWVGRMVFVTAVIAIFTVLCGGVTGGKVIEPPECEGSFVSNDEFSVPEEGISCDNHPKYMVQKGAIVHKIEAQTDSISARLNRIEARINSVSISKNQRRGRHEANIISIN